MCRHFCVCSECFVHVDKCPVCRASFDKYVMVEKECTEINVPRCPLEISTSRNQTRDVNSAVAEGDSGNSNINFSNAAAVAIL